MERSRRWLNDEVKMPWCICGKFNNILESLQVRSFIRYYCWLLKLYICTRYLSRVKFDKSNRDCQQYEDSLFTWVWELRKDPRGATYGFNQSLRPDI